MANRLAIRCDDMKILDLSAKCGSSAAVTTPWTANAVTRAGKRSRAAAMAPPPPRRKSCS